jgi:hypothetical protein
MQPDPPDGMQHVPAWHVVPSPVQQSVGNVQRPCFGTQQAEPRQVSPAQHSGSTELA